MAKRKVGTIVWMDRIILSSRVLVTATTLQVLKQTFTRINCTHTIMRILERTYLYCFNMRMKQPIQRLPVIFSKKSTIEQK